VRDTLVERFFSDWSASVQHQGYLMGEAALETVPEIIEIDLRLPNQHHLPFDLTRFGMEWEGTVFHPVSEPYGDIYLTVTR
jgi:urate oxidase